VQFADTSTPGTAPITSWLWSFGDSGTSTAQSPMHTYAVAGAYDVSLTVATSVGSHTATTPALVTVADPVPPIADFTAGPRSGNKSLAVQFADVSIPGTAPITAWAWTFGDGGSSTAQSPSHIYTTSGVYNVSLTVTTAIGGNTKTQSQYITVGTPGGPSALFSASPTSGLAPLTVQFADASTPGAMPFLSWAWNFGDGSVSTQQSPTHTYAPGTYNVTLTVTTAAGSDTESKPALISVNAPGGPTADFTASPVNGRAPLTVQFASNSTAGSAPITAWLWNFGDTNTSTLQAPTHTYAVAGTYAVSLTVTTSVGSDPEAKTGYITVLAATDPAPAFNADVTTGSAPLTVQFIDQSTEGSSNIVGWLWNFGDGLTSTEQHPLHTYMAQGTYTVSLTITPVLGNSKSLAKAGYITVATGTPVAGLFGLGLLASAVTLIGSRRLRRK